MARQPLTRSSAFGSTLFAGWVLVAGCTLDPAYEGAFELPTAVAVLQPETGGPFEQPVGFVANAIGGNIILLDLKFGRFLTDDPTASFLRTNWLPTGGTRLLAAVAPYAPAPDQVTVYAADRAFETLLRVPYIVGLDAQGFPIDGFIDAAGELQEGPVITDVRELVSGSATLEDLEVKDGYTTTETWVVEFVPSRGGWLVTGSRSGMQGNLAVPGLPYFTDQRRLAFTLQGEGTEGDRFEIDTDSGIREIDVGGIPYQLAMSPDQTTLAMSVGAADNLDQAALRFFDPASEALTDVALPADAEPARLAWSPDGFSLIASDANLPAIWEISADGATIVQHVMPWPTMDVAPLYSLELGRLVYVVPIEGQEVWIYDLDAGAFLDVNAAVPGDQGMPFESPVLGIEAIPLPHLYREVTDDGVRRSGRSVAVSLHEGEVVFMEEGSGCLLQDELGPRTNIDGSIGQTTDVFTNFADDIPFSAFMQQNVENTRHVVVNSCAGIASNEAWSLRFDRNVAAWVVDGGLVGEQENLAFEDERYLSDNGEVSFVIRAGSVPSQEGWEMSFTVIDGVLAANGDNDNDGRRDVPMDVPGDPAFFYYEVGPVEGAWALVDLRAFVLVPAQAADVVGRVDPQEGDVEIRWD